MSTEGREGQQTTTTVESNGAIGGNSHPPPMKSTATAVSCQRLRLNPNNEHKPDNYEGLQLDFPNSIYASLEKYLPPNLLVSKREEKVKFMTDIMLRHLPHGERSRVSFKVLTFLSFGFRRLMRWDLIRNFLRWPIRGLYSNLCW